MPIHLPPISRRDFLTRSVVAGAGILFAQNLFAAAKKTDPNFWAFFSDTHLAANRAQLGSGINMAEHFTSVSDELLSCATRPAGVFITGDCAFNSGEETDYATLTEMLEPIRKERMPIHIALGNHDHRERFWKVLQRQKTIVRPLADKQVAILQTPRVNWFILDSLEKTLSTPGLLGQPQLD